MGAPVGYYKTHEEPNQYSARGRYKYDLPGRKPGGMAEQRIGPDAEACQLSQKIEFAKGDRIISIRYSNQNSEDEERELVVMK